MNLQNISRIFSSAFAPRSARRYLLSMTAVILLTNTGNLYAENPPGPVIGDSHQKVLTIGQKQIPLPPGAWEVILYDAKLAFTTKGSPIGKIANLILARRQNGIVTMAINVRTNLEQISASGWVRNRSVCDRKNVHFNESDRNYNTEESECWQVNHLVNVHRYTDSNVLRQQFSSYQRTEFGTTTAVGPEFWLNDKYDMLFLRYYLLPVRHGYEASTDAKWKTSEWHPEAIVEDAEKQRFVAAAKAYGAALYPLVEKGFRNALKGEAASADFAFRK